MKRLSVGDILEVALPKGFAYLQLIGEFEPFKFDVFAVIRNHGEKTRSMEDLPIGQPPLYYMCSLATVILKDSRFRRTGWRAGSNLTMPPLRMSVVDGWRIIDDVGESLVKTLDEDSARLSLVEGVPAEEIIRRLESGWSPVQERDGIAQLLRRQREHAARPTYNNVTFFVNFGEADLADKAITDLQNRDFEVSREGKTALAARHRFVGKAAALINELRRIEKNLERVCAARGGIITGHELE